MIHESRIPSPLMHAGFKNTADVQYPDIQHALQTSRLEIVRNKMRGSIALIIGHGIKTKSFRPRDENSQAACTKAHYVLVSPKLDLPLGGFSLEPDIDDNGKPCKEIGCLWSGYENAGIAWRMTQLLQEDPELYQQSLYALAKRPSNIFMQHGFRSVGGIDDMAHMPTNPVLPDRIRHYAFKASRHPIVHMNLFQAQEASKED